MLVRIQRDFDFPDIRQQSPSSACRWGDVHFTFEPVKECDLLIALNPPREDIRVRCPNGNRWLFTGESPIDQYKWHIDSFKYFDKVFAFWDTSVAVNIIHDQTSLPWHVGKSYDELMNLTCKESFISKKDRVSWVTSNASHKEGHKLRMAFKAFLIEQEFGFDLFGRGFNPINDKFDGIFPYKYSIAIENYSCDDYWTEKIADCFLSWTIPIYWGAKNILSYFPEKSIILIDPSDHKKSLNIIRHAIENDYFHSNLGPLAEARDLVLNKYQFFPHVCKLIKQYNVKEVGKRVKSFIPANQIHTGPTNAYTFFKKTLQRALFR